MATPITSNSLKLNTPKVSDAWKSALSGYGINADSGLMYRKQPTTTTAKTSAVTASPAATGTASPVVAKPAAQSPQTSTSSIYDTLGQISSRLQQPQKESTTKKDKTKSNYVDTLMGVPKTQDYYAAARGAMDEYIKSLLPSDAEKKTQGDLDAIGASLATGLQTASEQAIPMGFITGQQQSIENRAINRTIPLEAQLKRLQGDRTATSEGLLAKYGLETSLAAAAREDDRYAREEAAAAKAAEAELQFKKDQLEYEMGKPLVVGEGSTIYDPATGQVLYKAPKTYAPSSSGSGSGGTYGGVSDAARNIIEQINLGANLDDLIKGNSNAAQSLRNEVLAGLNAQGGLTTRQQELFQEAKNAVDSLINDGGYKALGGYSTRLGGQFTTAYGDAQAQAQQLEAILARDNLGLLKGAMSDKDLAFIQSMSSGFKGEGIQSESFIKGRLEEIQKKLQGKLDAATPSSSSGGSSGGSYESYLQSINKS